MDELISRQDTLDELLKVRGVGKKVHDQIVTRVMDLPAQEHMLPNDYQTLCLRTASPVSMATDENLLLQGAMGMCGESGEFMDIVKKYFFHGHPLDQEHLKLELGDIMWYVATTAHALGIPLEEVMKDNIEKLKLRYPDGFTTSDSMHRSPTDI